MLPPFLLAAILGAMAWANRSKHAVARRALPALVALGAVATMSTLKSMLAPHSWFRLHLAEVYCVALAACIAFAIRSAAVTLRRKRGRPPGRWSVR